MKERATIILPSFRMGMKEKEYEQAQSEGWVQLPEHTYHYPGKTVALTDARAAVNLAQFAGGVHGVPLHKVDIMTDRDTERLLQENRHRYFFLLGTRSHKAIREILNQHNHDFDFEFAPDEWSIVDRRTNTKYSVADPSRMKSAEEAKDMDYALLERIVDDTNHRVLYAIGGMWDSSTEGASEFLLVNRGSISQEFGEGGFQYLLKFRAGSSQVADVELVRGQRDSHIVP